MSGPPTESSSHGLDQTVPGEPSPEGQRTAYAAAEPLARGVTIGRYTVLERIGSGGMGVVYSAFDPELDRRVALKVLHGGGPGSLGSTDGRNRLLREAQAMAKLHHPNVITVHDVGTFGDRVFVAMEFVDGRTLREWLKDGTREWQEVVDNFVRAGRGLAAAHAVGLVHRDFKPDNVLVGGDGRVLVMDFGLARQAGTPLQLELAASSRGGLTTPLPDAMLTRTGAVLGTPAYMAPEQHSGGVIGPAVDQFSFCVALYEGLWGERPFTGNSVASLALAVLEGKPRRPPRDADAPAWLFEVIARGLAVDPNDRFPSMDALLAELQRDPPRSSRPAVTIGVALGVAGAIVAAYLGTRPDPAEHCADESTKFAALLDEPTAAAVGDAFAATAVEHAATSWHGAQQRLQRYDTQWRAAWLAACQARYAQPAEQAAMAEQQTCLENLRGDAQLLVEYLRTADATTVDHAVEAVRALPPLGMCTVPSTRRAATEVARRVDLRPVLLAARTAVRLGRWRDAAERLAGFVVTPVPLEDLAVEAELLTLHGHAEQHLGHEAAGRASLRRAILAASTAGDARLEREAWLVLIAGLAQTVRSHEEAWPTLVATEAAIRRDGDDDDARTRWLVAHGDVHLALGRHRDALERYDRAQADLRTDADALDRAMIAARRCVALAAVENPGEATAACAEAVTQLTADLGATHPRVAAALADLGTAQFAGDDVGAAAASFELARQSLDPDDRFGIGPSAVPGPLAPTWDRPSVPLHAPLLARVLDRSGIAERSRQRFESAAKWHALAAALMSRIGTRAGLGYPLTNLGVALLDLERPTEALPHLQRAVALLEAELPDDHPDLPIAKLDLANALAASGQWADAGAQYQAVLERWEDRLTPDHPLLAYALTGIARARIELDDASAAIDPLERALELRGDTREDETNLAETSWLLARALFSSGSDEPRALELATKALVAVRAQPVTDPLELRRLLAGGSLAGVTDRLTPASLTLVHRTPFAAR